MSFEAKNPSEIFLIWVFEFFIAELEGEWF
jgi:hypothetical protein